MGGQVIGEYFNQLAIEKLEKRCDEAERAAQELSLIHI